MVNQHPSISPFVKPKKPEPPKKKPSPIKSLTSGLKNLLTSPESSRSKKEQAKASKSTTTSKPRVELPYDEPLPLEYPRQRAARPTAKPFTRQEYEFTWEVIIPFDRHHPVYDSPVVPRPALLVTSPEAEEAKPVYWSSLNRERYENDRRHSIFWLVEREAPAEMHHNASIDAMLMWKRVNVDVNFQTTAPPGNLIMEQSAKRCMEHLLVSGTGCLYLFKANPECNEAGIDERWLRAIYLEEAKKQSLEGRIAFT